LWWLPAALILYPFGFIPLQVATVVFVALSTGVLAFALTRDGWWRLPLLLSAPMWFGALSGQITPLLVAAMLIPSLGWLAPMKFTLGAAGALYTLSKRYVLLGLGTTIISIILFPSWPKEWLAELADVAGRYYHIPVQLPGGVIGLVALVRWRRPEARLFVAMTLLPQTMFYYDQLPLGLVARSHSLALRFALVSWLAPVGVILMHRTASADRATLFGWNAPVILALYYLPCLLLILRRPNEGELPTWAQKATVWLPRSLRGEPEHKSSP
jgi:hypothetical protein